MNLSNSMTTKKKQAGAPVRVGAYQISVLTEPPGDIARAVLVDEFNRDLPCVVLMTTGGLEINDGNVASDTLAKVPSDVLRGLLRVSGWKCEYPDDLNPHFSKEMGK